MVSKKQGWDIQKNSSFLNTIQKGLLVNHQRHGYFLCPCREGAGVRKKDQDIVCPCVYNIPDQQEYGYCFCGLFFAKGAQNEEDDFQQIPDRRPDERYD